MSAHRRILRYTVPIDDDSHSIGAGPVVMIRPARPARVQDAWRQLEVWVEVHLPTSWPSSPEVTQHVQVVGTGHRVPEAGSHLGSTVTDDGELVWHLYSVLPAGARVVQS